MDLIHITGTSRGIGKALAESFLENGDFVIGYSRNQSIQHSNYSHHKIDLSQPEKVAELSFKNADDFDRIILINNSASLGDVDTIGDLDDQKIINAFSLNVIAPAILMNRFINQYEHHQGKKIILNISSGAGKKAVDGWSIYCASKAALDSFSKVMGKEVEIHDRNDFRVLSVAPGIVDTQMQSEIREVNTDQFSRVQDFKDFHIKNQLVPAKEVARKLIRTINEPLLVGDVLGDIREFE